MKGDNLDYRKRETHLLFILEERYKWDWAKLIFVLLYLILILAIIIGGYLGYKLIPIEYEIYFRPPAISTVAFALFTLWRQWVNIKEFKDIILPKAGKIADEHARIGGDRQEG